MYMYETLFTLTGHGMSEVEKRPPPTLPRRHVMYLGRFDSEVFFCFFLTLETCELALYCTKSKCDRIWVGEWGRQLEK